MKRGTVRAGAFACLLLAGSTLASPTFAQAAAQPFRSLDSNGVDLVQGDFVMAFKEGSIGSGRAELPLVRTSGAARASQYDGYTFRRDVGGALSSVTIDIGLPGATRDRFTLSSGVFVSSKANGATLTGSNGNYTYTAADGTTIAYSDPTGGDWYAEATSFCSGYSTALHSTCYLTPDTIAAPDGATLTFAWNVYEISHASFEWTLASVANSYGYSAAFSYDSSNALVRTGAAFHNSAAGTGAQASVSYAYPSGASADIVDVTDMAGNVWRVTDTSVRRPGESSAGFSVSRSSGVVSSVTRDGVTTGYSRSVSGTTGTMTVTDASSHTTTVVSDLNIGRPTSVTDPLSRTTSYGYDSSGRLTRVTSPEGNYAQYTLDSRGNVTQTSFVPKSGSGLSTITSSASYPSSCTNAKTCNEPTSTTDARGNSTDYTYDSTHGGVLTATAPAPTTGATRPQTRYSYTLTNGEYLLTGVAACVAGSSCAGTSDEAKSTFAYDSSGNLTSASSGNGSGTLTATSAMTYDAMGNLLTADGPLSGTADTTRYRYDAAGRLVGVTSPDPDGSGSMKPRAVRTTFNSSGLPTKVERGSVNSQSDSDWSGFSASEAVETGYDSNFRPTSTKLTSGSTIYALTQTSYDALGRPECVAQRMNPSIFPTITTGACSLGTQGSGSNDFGPDRILKTAYDAAGQVTTTTSAYGVSGQQSDDVTRSYTSNGLLSTVTDAEGNKTTYGYDGLDRLVLTYFPSTTKGAGTSSTTDYEQVTYDANGNVTNRRLRDGNSIAFTYDALNRVTAKNLPNLATYEFDIGYSYDNLGRMTQALDSNTHYINLSWDVLGRMTNETSNFYSRTSSYDLAGHRTRLTHGDGFYVDYDYLVTGEMAHVRENGATSGVGVLATYGYDDLGRRTSLTRGNGTSTSYSYDAVSRLSQLSEDISGTTYDQTLGFSYSPASQITTNTRSNDTYAWGGHYNVTKSYTANGLNQYTVAGSASPTYDSRGNLTSAGSTTFAYTSENRLASYGSTLLAYDPLGRLHYYPGASLAWMYDGDQLLAELNTANLSQIVRRYVYGPDADEPIVWYEGSGTTDRRFLHTDERGSVVAVTNSSGSVIGVNSYDEYGVPASGNIGRFQYTGQAWMSDVGLYYYKARMYSSGLGRFLQTDPIGYGAGPNWYNYVRSDPVNSRDPSGLQPHKLNVLEGQLDHPVIEGNIIDALGDPWVALDLLKAEWDAEDKAASDAFDKWVDDNLRSKVQGNKPLEFSYANVEGGQIGKDLWEIRWTFSEFVSGWIIQTLDVSGIRYGKPFKYNTGWEGFKVTDGRAPNDVFMRNALGVSELNVDATAYFYQGIRLPSNYRVGGTPFTGNAPSSYTKGNLPSPTAGPITRHFRSGHLGH